MSEALAEASRIVAISAGVSLLVGVLGWALLLPLRRRSLPASLTVVAGVPVLAVLIGAAVAAQAMLLAPRDFAVVLLVLASAGTVALLVALLLGRQVSRASRTLLQAARAVGQGERVTVQPTPSTAELAELSRELERASTHLAEARERERALESSRRELVAWVSHDLRTPLAGLQAMAEALEDGIAEEPERYYKQIRVEVGRLSTLVNDLFELSRIAAGSLRLSVEQVPLSAFVTDAIAGVHALAGRHQVRLVTDTSMPAPVLVDVVQLSRVLANLVGNAVRHTPPGGRVALTTAQRGDDAVLAVTDQCGGIPEPELDKVFEPSWRGGASRSPDGAGLGLAIARGIVEAHGGRISVANVDDGCRFEVRLPLAEQLEPAARASGSGT